MATPLADKVLDSEEIQPTMIVGLGGSGKKILTRLKTRFLKDFGEVPDNVRLVSFDIDPYEEVDTLGEQGVRLTPNEEFFDIGNVPAGDIVRQIRSKKEVYPELRTWLDPEIPLQESNLRRGGQQNRQLGRLALFWNLQTRNMRNVLEGKYLQLREPKGAAGIAEKRLSNTVVVYILGSLAGGTGGGMIIDTAFVVRDIANSMGLADDTSIVGVLILPRVFDMVKQEAIQPNALAALKEIDYFMSIPDKNRKLNKILYSGEMAISSMIQPFNICYVIDAIGATGKALVGPERLFPMVVDAVYLLAGSKMGSQAWSNINNIGRAFSDKKVFSSLGVASLVFPAYEIHHLIAAHVGRDVVASHFLGTITEGLDTQMTQVQKDVDRFLTKLRAGTPELIGESLGLGSDGKKMHIDLREDDRLSRPRLAQVPRNQVHSRVNTTLSELTADFDVKIRKRLDVNRGEFMRLFLESDDGLPQYIKAVVDNPQERTGIEVASFFLKELKTRLTQLEIDADRFQRDRNDRFAQAESRLESRDQELKEIANQNGLIKKSIERPRDEYIQTGQERTEAYLAKEISMATKQIVVEMLSGLGEAEKKLKALLDRLVYVKDSFLPEKIKYYQQEINGMDAVRRLPVTRQQDIEKIYAQRKDAATHKIIQSVLGGSTGLLALADEDSDVLGLAIYNAALESLSDIYNIQLEDLVKEREKETKDPVSHTEWLTKVEENAEVFWRYEEAQAGAKQGLGQLIQVTGVKDTKETIYKGTTSQMRSYCSTNNPHLLTVLQMQHGLDYRHMSQIASYEANYRAALKQNRTPHIFPEYNFGSNEDQKWFALGVAYAIAERRGPFWIMPDPDGGEEITLAERGTLADAVWKAVHFEKKLILFLKNQVNAKMWDKSVTKPQRLSALKQLKRFQSSFDWKSANTDLESEWLADKFKAYVDEHIKEVEEYLI